MNRRSFGPASEEPYRRRPSDWARLVIAVALLVLMARHSGDVTEAEQNLFQSFNSLPDGLESLFRGLYVVGTLWGVGLVFVAGLVARRWRLARDLLLSGVLASVIGRVVGALVVQHADLGKSLDTITRLRNASPSFPSVRLAVVVAIVVAAGPYLTRPTRRIGHLLVLLLALSAMYLGTAYPADLLAAVTLGWGVGAAVHLVFGSPGGRPTTSQVAASLDELGVKASDLHLAPRQRESANLWLARDPDGPLRVKVIGRDEADAQLFAKLWRSLLYKDSRGGLLLSRLQKVEHEAYATLLARDGGTRVPEVLVAASAGPRAALLVERPLAGPTLADTSAATVTDELLEEVWAQVANLHAVRVAHGILNASRVVISPEGPGIADFIDASTASTPDRRPLDVAELLASTAAIVGEERAVAAALKGIGPEALARGLPFLQPAALSRETRAPSGERRKERKRRLDRLMKLGAAAAGAEVPPLQELHRVKKSSLVMAVGLFVAVGALLSQVGDPAEMWETVKNAEWGWVFVAFVLSMATNLGFAIALMGAVPDKLPLLPTTELQVSMSFTNLVIPGVGGTAEQVRFVQKQGADLASAVASGGLLPSVASPAAQLMLLVVAIPLTPDSFDFPSIPTKGVVTLVLGLILLAGLAGAIVFGVPRIRRTVMPSLRQAGATLWSALRSPSKLALLLGGNAIAAILYAFCLWACLQAFGTSLSIWTLLVLNIAVGTLASLVPIPGGSTAVSSVGISGALTAFGIPTEVAVSAVLTNQIVVNYLPALIGWFATNHLVKRDYL